MAVSVLILFALLVSCTRDPCPSDTGLIGSERSGQQSCAYQDSNGVVVKHGPFIEWHPNGQESMEGTYRNGKQDGHWTFWNESGRKTFERDYREGEMVAERKL